MTQHDIQFEIEGVIKLLAQNLYANTDVFLREMLQNAKDSTLKRAEVAVARGDEEVPAPRIEVVSRQDDGVLVISDNGAGLTRDEIHEYLSTIGRSGTRALRDELEAAGRREAVELIGQFGIGLLSAFLVADEIELVTRPAGTKHDEALLWRSGGGRSYEVVPAEREAVGTTVTLKVRDKHVVYLRSDKLTEIICRYADFIGVPIHLNGSCEPVNMVRAPWRVDYGSQAARIDAYRTYWRARFVGEEDLSVLILDDAIEWREDGKVYQGRLEGVMGLASQRVIGGDLHDQVDLYVRNMFITSRPTDLMPEWANFMRGVVQCDALRPNAARDGVMKDAILLAVHRALGAAILRHFRAMAEQDPRQLKGILRLHARSILSVAAHPDHSDFFRAIAELLPLRTDDRPMTLPDYCETAESSASGRSVVYYVRDYTAMNQYRLLVSARGVHVFDASEAFAEGFLQRYAGTYPEKVELRRLDADEKVDFLGALPTWDQMVYRGLQTAGDRVLADEACRVEIARFEPQELPALIVEPVRRRRRREMEGVVAELGVPSFLQSAVSELLHEEVEFSVLYLNATNETVNALARHAPNGGEFIDASLRALYANASLLSGRRLAEAETRRFFSYNTQVLDLLLAEAREGEP